MKNTLKSLGTLTVSLIAIAFTTEGVNAATLTIAFDDTDGPNWIGTVDTAANTLTITSWTENSGGNAFWTPSALPLSPWVARDSGGNLFDVPDTFDGTISTSFAFISDQALTDIGWNEGSSSSFWNTTRPGWGGYVQQGSLNVSPSESTFGFVPVSSANAFTGQGTATVVPEPSSALLLGLASLGIAARRRRTN